MVRSIMRFATITPRIDLDDHKLFEKITNEFSIFGDYFYDISGSPRD